MAKKKNLTQGQLAQLRFDYLTKREELLQKKVNSLGIKLYDKVFEKYLKNLQTQDGRIISTKDNMDLIRGLDMVYKKFNREDNILVIKQFVQDAQGVTPMNTQYFEGIQPKPVTRATELALQTVNKGLGITEAGNPIAGGFVDKFIRDETLLKKIKKQTIQAIVNGKGFQQFRQELKVTIQGTQDKPLSGGLQQYYRNYAYDTLHKVDRINQDVFAKNLKLKFFYYSGGVIKTTRKFCRLCNGKIINAQAFSKLRYFNLRESLRSGIPNPWNPLEDLGGYGCRHFINYISDALAMEFKKSWLNFSLIIK